MAGARRNSLSVGLAVGAGLALLIGAILLYARVEVIDEDAFADNAVEALQDDATRDVIATELVIGLVENGSPNLVAARPLVQSVVDTVIDTAPFRQVFREAARQTNLLLFERDEAQRRVRPGRRLVGRAVRPRVGRSQARGGTAPVGRSRRW